MVLEVTVWLRTGEGKEKPLKSKRRIVKGELPAEYELHDARRDLISPCVPWCVPYEHLPGRKG